MPDADGIYRPAYTQMSTFNPNKRIKYWYSRAGAENKAFLNIKRTSASGKLMATNFEMTHVPEALCHSVYYYMLCRYDVNELHWALMNCLQMVEGSRMFDHERAEEFARMKMAPIPSDPMTGQAETAEVMDESA